MAASRQRERELERQRRLRQEQRRQAARRRARRRNQIVASVLAVGLLLSGIALLSQTIGPSSPSSAQPTPTPSVPFPPVPAGADPRLKLKPTATLPKTPPTKLGITDLIVGKGPAVRSGQQVTVNYVGVGYPGGKEFDSSWTKREPFRFQLGSGNVIKGWDRGVAGMKVGGRRHLSIPAALAYGRQGQPPDIKPNQPLVFVVDLLAAQ